ncbi:hypothetical protein BURK2_03160 [Burkholderiales bacterium]|nr:hypothetical protein BURK2_03160 [Burkholderiales bacterium]
MRSLSLLIGWLSRAWPVLSFLPIALCHQAAHTLFPTDPVFVNKVTGTTLQLIGGLIVLHSVNANLGLFRNQHLGEIVLGWFRSFPLFRKAVTISASGIGSIGISGSARISFRRAANTLEERVIEIERQLEEFRTHVTEDLLAANNRITQVHTELSTAVASNAAAVNQLSSRLEHATVGGFKQQAFGVLLATYGAVTSVFA